MKAAKQKSNSSEEPVPLEVGSKGSVSSNGMKVIMFSTDTRILEEGSNVRSRMLDYGRIFDALEIILLSRKGGIDGSEHKLSDNVKVTLIHSKTRVKLLHKLYKATVKIIEKNTDDKKSIFVTSQDPFELGYVAYKIAKRTRVHLQLQVHTDLFSKSFASESLHNKLRVKIAKRIIPHADSIRVVSEKLKDNLIEKWNIPESRIIVLPIFVDISRFKEIIPRFDLHKVYSQFSYIILMASRLTVEKNYDLALRQFQKVARKYPYTGLLIVGSGPRKSHLERLVKSLGIEKNVIFEPWQSDLLSYYKSADLFLVTSDYEGYGMTLLEAAASGVPILSTDVGIAREVINEDKNGYICEINDGKCLLEKFEKIMKEDGLKERLRFGAKAMAESIKSLSKKDYLETYRKTFDLAKANRGIRQMENILKK